MKTRKAKGVNEMNDETTVGSFTPGPWRNNGGQIESEHLDYNRPVAVVGVVNNQTRTNTANARLIAAAPELLEALKLAERRLTDFCDRPDENGYVVAADSVERLYLKRIRQTIAKVENGKIT